VFLEVDGEAKPVVSFDVLSEITAIKKGNTLTLTVPSEKDDPTIYYFPPGDVITFSNREIELLKLVDAGFTSKEIASQLSISNHTVDTHRRNMIRKAKVRNTSQLIAYVRDTGLF